MSLDLKPALSEWLKRRFTDVKYASVSVEERRSKATTYSAGEEDEESERSLIVRADGFRRDNTIEFCSSELEDTGLSERSLRIGLTAAKRNFTRPPIFIPSSKNLKKPSNYWKQSENGELVDISEWELDGNLAADLKGASEIDVERLELPKVTSRLECSKFWFLDSDGIYREWSFPLYQIKLDLVLNDRRSMTRYTGFAPRKVDQLPNVYRILRYVQDLTPDQRLKVSKDFTELMSGLKSVTKDLETQKVEIGTGSIPIITPMITFSHENVGHFFEEPFTPLRTEVEQEKVMEAEYFSGGQTVGPETLTIRDNPKFYLQGLPLVGTRDCDMEGFPASVKSHIVRGKVTGETLGSKYSSGMNVGNAFSGGVYLPQPRMTVTETLYDPNGPNTVGELLEMANNKALLCIRDHGFADTVWGNFVLGASGDLKEYSPDVEVYLLEKRNGEVVYSPVKTPHVVVGLATLSLKDITVGGPRTFSYDPAFCSCSNPVTQSYDRIVSSQVGPLALIPHTTVRTLRNLGELKV